MPNQVRPAAVKEDRDPNHINDHIKINFNEILGEPYGSHSFGPVWQGAELCYSCCRDLWYGLFGCCCGVWIALYWGYVFGIVAFQHIWILTPLRLTCEMVMYSFRCFRPVVNCCIQPWTGAFAHIFVSFAAPGTDSSKWGYPEIKIPVKRVAVKKNLPVPVKRTDKKAQQEQDMFLGEKARMAKSVQRQLML